MNSTDPSGEKICPTCGQKVETFWFGNLYWPHYSNNYPTGKGCPRSNKPVPKTQKIIS